MTHVLTSQKRQSENVSFLKEVFTGMELASPVVPQGPHTCGITLSETMRLGWRRLAQSVKRHKT